MGENAWRTEREWPLARAEEQRWYLHSGGSANSLLGDGGLSPEAPGEEPDDTFAYDPHFPVPTTGGNNCCSPHIVPWGPYDQRPVEMRGDVLCYTSEPLTEDLEVTGPIFVTLCATTDGPDTDWTAKLVDVHPNGYAMNLCDGILRARYRESRSDPTLVAPGKAHEYAIRVGGTSNVFKKGHRIRLEISSSNFPRFDRNLNTGHEPGMDAEMRVAHQQVHHSRARASYVVLPIVRSLESCGWSLEFGVWGWGARCGLVESAPPKGNREPTVGASFELCAAYIGLSEVLQEAPDHSGGFVSQVIKLFELVFPN